MFRKERLKLIDVLNMTEGDTHRALSLRFNSWRGWRCRGSRVARAPRAGSRSGPGAASSRLGGESVKFYLVTAAGSSGVSPAVSQPLEISCEWVGEFLSSEFERGMVNGCGNFKVRAWASDTGV